MPDNQERCMPGIDLTEDKFMEYMRPPHSPYALPSYMLLASHCIRLPTLHLILLMA